jgi:NAD(P)-dependent dehydrogenase (short-subunit alcohol dehydrogenase family)
MKTAILTGACSAIGSAIWEELLKRDYAVHGWCRHKGIDLLKEETIPEVEKADLLVHVAEVGLPGLLNVAIKCGAALEQSKGCLIGISSVSRIIDQNEYARSKEVQENEMSSWARGARFRVNVLRLGHIVGTKAWPHEVAEKVREVPLGRFGTPHEVADAVAWMAQASWLNGCILNLDGGMLAGIR